MLLCGCFNKNLEGTAYTIRGDGSIVPSASIDVYLIPWVEANTLNADATEQLFKSAQVVNCRVVETNIPAYSYYEDQIIKSEKNCNNIETDFPAKKAALLEKEENIKETANKTQTLFLKYRI